MLKFVQKHLNELTTTFERFEKWLLGEGKFRWMPNFNPLRDQRSHTHIL